MTRDQLRSLNCKQLADMARRRGLAGWHDLRKEQLVEALFRALRNESRRKKSAPLQHAAARNTTDDGPEFPVAPPPRAVPTLPAAAKKDRVVLLVRGPFWLSCHWELTPQTVARAEAALGQDWHASRPVLRLLEVTGGDAGRIAERHVRDIPIHGGVNAWYIDVMDPPKAYRVDIGYLTRSGRFYGLARSDAATTPRPGAGDDAFPELSARSADRLAAMTSGFDPHGASADVRQFLEERLRRPLGAPLMLSLGAGRREGFSFEIEASLIVSGRTKPGARVRLQNQPVDVSEDGSFAVRFELPDHRQIIRCVATSPDGGEERTVILHVERNIRQLEPAALLEPE